MFKCFRFYLFLLLILRLNFGVAAIRTSSSETVKKYEIHTPVINKDLNQDDPKKVQVKLSQFILHLEQNQMVVHPEFINRYFDCDGNEITEKGHRNCFYHGFVEGHSDWQLSVSTCNGLQGSFGKQGSKNEFYHVEPVDPRSNELDQPHILYLDSQYSKETQMCGDTSHQPKVQNLTEVPPPDSGDIKEVGDIKKVHRRQVNGFYFVELAIINDQAQFDSLGQNVSNVVMKSLAIANQMDIFYRSLNIRIVLVSVETWTAGNRITYPASNEATSLLDNLSKYVSHERVPDGLLLITGTDLKGEALGTAFSGTMCDSHKSIGLVQDRLSSIEAIGSRASHELGHILNMAHDDGRACSCSDHPAGACIMSATAAYPPPTQWSSCSHSDLLDGFTYKKLSRCLKNEPTDTVADPVCGNRIREVTEECDCGSVEECTDSCCNSSTCTLRDGAQCSEGPCCSEECQFLPQNQTCRVPSQECDIVERCSGKSSDCPQDLYKQDGTSCGGKGEAFCFDGICQSLDLQCQRFFLTRSSVKECYSRYNIVGSRHGNCGTHNGQLLPCAPEHAQCGQLMCDGGIFQEHEVSISVVTATRTTLVGSAFETCTSFSSSPLLEERNPGLVPDGIKCGDNSICVSQSCTAIESLQHVHPCPVGGNGKSCSGEGVCNNLNLCSCNRGFFGISCNESSSKTDNSVEAGEEVQVIAAGVIGGILVTAILTTVLIIILCVMALYSRKTTALKKLRLCSAQSEKCVGLQVASHDRLCKDNLVEESVKSSVVNIHHKSLLS